jgi:hypothetical protein
MQAQPRLTPRAVASLKKRNRKARATASDLSVPPDAHDDAQTSCARTPVAKLTHTTLRIGRGAIVGGRWLGALAALALASHPPIGWSAPRGLTIGWTNNFLTVTSPELPGGAVEILYLEAFCRSGSTHRDWRQTTLPHRTELVDAAGNGKRVRLRTSVESQVVVRHDIRARRDEVEFRLTLKNKGAAPVDVQWFQPCLRVGGFTGLGQSNYFQRCFIFTRDGLTTLDKTRRTEAALYRGGQVYVPGSVNLEDVNPRPLSPDQPINGLIGCFSADGKYLLATAWDQTQELFQGVIVCIHNDPRAGGLEAGESKKLRGKLYFLKNDPGALLRRYQRDFPKTRP